MMQPDKVKTILYTLLCLFFHGITNTSCGFKFFYVKKKDCRLKVQSLPVECSDV